SSVAVLDWVFARSRQNGTLAVRPPPLRKLASTGSSRRMPDWKIADFSFVSFIMYGVKTSGTMTAVRRVTPIGRFPSKGQARHHGGPMVAARAAPSVSEVFLFVETSGPYECPCQFRVRANELALLRQVEMLLGEGIALRSRTAMQLVFGIEIGTDPGEREREVRIHHGTVLSDNATPFQRIDKTQLAGRAIRQFEVALVGIGLGIAPFLHDGPVCRFDS